MCHDTPRFVLKTPIDLRIPLGVLYVQRLLSAAAPDLVFQEEELRPA